MEIASVYQANPEDVFMTIVEKQSGTKDLTFSDDKKRRRYYLVVVAITLISNSCHHEKASSSLLASPLRRRYQHHLYQYSGHQLEFFPARLPGGRCRRNWRMSSPMLLLLMFFLNTLYIILVYIYIITYRFYKNTEINAHHVK